MKLRDPNGIEFRSFYFTNPLNFFRKFPPKSGKTHHVRLNLGISRSGKQNPCTFLTILTRLNYVSYMQNFIRKSETLGPETIRRLEISNYCLS